MELDKLARESILSGQEVNTFKPASWGIGIFWLGYARHVDSEVDTRDSLARKLQLAG